MSSPPAVPGHPIIKINRLTLSAASASVGPTQRRQKLRSGQLSLDSQDCDPLSSDLSRSPELATRRKEMPPARSTGTSPRMGTRSLTRPRPTPPWSAEEAPHSSSQSSSPVHALKMPPTFRQGLALSPTLVKRVTRQSQHPPLMGQSTLDCRSHTSLRRKIRFADDQNLEASRGHLGMHRRVIEIESVRNGSPRDFTSHQKKIFRSVSIDASASGLGNQDLSFRHRSLGVADKQQVGRSPHGRIANLQSYRLNSPEHSKFQQRYQDVVFSHGRPPRAAQVMVFQPVSPREGYYSRVGVKGAARRHENLARYSVSGDIVSLGCSNPIARPGRQSSENFRGSPSPALNDPSQLESPSQATGARLRSKTISEGCDNRRSKLKNPPVSEWRRSQTMRNRSTSCGSGGRQRPNWEWKSSLTRLESLTKEVESIKHNLSNIVLEERRLLMNSDSTSFPNNLHRLDVLNCHAQTEIIQAGMAYKNCLQLAEEIGKNLEEDSEASLERAEQLMAKSVVAFQKMFPCAVQKMKSQDDLVMSDQSD